MSDLAQKDKKIKILVVEDDEHFRQALRILLTMSKYEVTEATNGKEAREILESRAFDLILSDIRMPHLLGTELLSFVRRTSQIPFILMTGFSDIIEASEAYKIGASGFVPKPFKPEELLKVISECLDKKDGVAGAEEASDKKFCRIHVDDFLGGKVLPVDIYIQLGKGKLVKIAHKGDEVLSEQIKSYKTKNVHYLYIREEDFPAYINANVKLSDMAAHHATASPVLKSRILKLTQEYILQDIYLRGMNREKFDSAAQVAKLTLSTVCENADILKLISDLNTQTDYLYAHSVGVSIYSVMIAQEIGWTSSGVHFKLSMAGLLHDVGKKEIDREILDKPRAQLNSAEIKLFETHGFRGKEILSSIPGIPSDVIAITLQHHENLYGQGPIGLEEKQIHPLAKVVALANRFCELTVKNPARKIYTPIEAIAMLKELGTQEFDQAAFAALEKMILPPPAST